ncbi:hypothetical protein B9Z55_002567 [Caenorhabditis nigoni]|uniref:Uncharacterized protein n=1 Tax=Caenorhabditis nigoni TaxID=1611254 RepID=A0A2G5VL39_9PELO|nr:hypothetical protein B9Z55_002567 [Caenorhabditis nigoni]
MLVCKINLKLKKNNESSDDDHCTIYKRKSLTRELRELYYFFRYFFRNQIQRLPWTPLQGLHDFSISHGKGYGKALISNSSNDLILTDWLKKISDKLDVMDQSRCLHWLLHQRTS